MLDYSDLKSYFEALNLSDKPVIVHASLKPFGYIKDGADALVRAMAASFKSIIMPTHTYKTMITPKIGPPNNAMTYGSDENQNKMAVPFKHDLPVDPMMGMLPEALRNHPMATRTMHPILSFAGINAESALATQSLFAPLAPIGALENQDGWVVLINMDHTVNTSIHYAERLAGRKQFVRWALVGNRAVACQNFPGDSSGFQAIEEYIQPNIFRLDLGKAFIQAFPLKRLFEVVQGLIKQDPLALLCERGDCDRCNAVRGIYAVG